MARIVLAGMEFHAHHGVFEEEASLGARFVVDVELEAPLPAGDELEAAVDYGRVYRLVRDEVTLRRHRLLETLAQAVTEALLAAEPGVEAVTVRVHKPHAPLPGIVRDVYVELRRRRG